MHEVLVQWFPWDLVWWWREDGEIQPWKFWIRTATVCGISHHSEMTTMAAIWWLLPIKLPCLEDGTIHPVRHYHFWIGIRGVFVDSVSSNRTDGIILLKVCVSEMMISHPSPHRHQLVNEQGRIRAKIRKGLMKHSGFCSRAVDSFSTFNCNPRT